MKKVVVFMAIMLALIILSTGTVFAAVNGYEAKASPKNPAFNVSGMHDMMIINDNNKDLHFSKMGHIMIPGNPENAKSHVFVPMSGMPEMTHLEPTGRVEQFD